MILCMQAFFLISLAIRSKADNFNFPSEACTMECEQVSITISLNDF